MTRGELFEEIVRESVSINLVSPETLQAWYGEGRRKEDIVAELRSVLEGMFGIRRPRVRVPSLSRERNRKLKL